MDTSEDVSVNRSSQSVSSLKNMSSNILFFQIKYMSVYLFPVGLWTKISIRHWAVREKKQRALFSQVVPQPQGSLRVAWLLLCCCTNKLINPSPSPTLTLLTFPKDHRSQGLLFLARGENTSDEVSQMQSSFVFRAVSVFEEHNILWGIFQNSHWTLRSKSMTSEDLLVLLAFGYCSAVQFFEICQNVKLMDYW